MIYLGSGQVWSPEGAGIVADYQIDNGAASGGALAVGCNLAADRASFIAVAGGGQGYIWYSHQISTGARLGMAQFGNIAGNITDLIQAGSSYIAIRTDAGEAAVIPASLLEASVGGNPLRQLSSAAGGVPMLAPGSLAAAYATTGTSLATGQPAAPGLPWPTSLEGTTVTIVDSTGASVQAPLTYVSSSQVNFQIPASVAIGLATVTVTSGNGTTATGHATLTLLAPSIFALNATNLAAAYAACVSSGGTVTTEDPFQVVNGALVAQPLNLSACAQTILELYGTGMDKATASNVQVMFGDVAGTVQYAGPGGGYPGLDQVNVVIPQSLAGSGIVPIVLSAGGMTANTVNVTIE
ncbi:MAG: hypothetical protein ABSF98_29780 [Bryobacteraceae bacterium]